MDDKLIVRIKEIKPDIRDSTIKTYLYNIQRLKNHLDAKDFDKVIKNKPAYVMKRLKKIKDYNKRKPLNLACIIYAKVIKAKRAEKIYKTYLREKLNPEYKQSHYDQQPSEKEKKNMITYEQLMAVLDNPINNKDFNLFLHLFINYPVRNEWSRVSLNENKPNHIKPTQEGYSLQITAYKTIKQYGEQTYNITDKKIIDLLKEHIGDRKDGNLFLNSKGNPWTGSGFITFIQKGFKKHYPDKNISTGMLRKILITEEMKNDPTLKALEEKRKAWSKKYLHSFSVANLIYRKV